MTAKIHLRSLLAADFAAPESFSNAQLRKCAPAKQLKKEFSVSPGYGLHTFLKITK